MARRCLNTEAQRHRARSCTVPDASRVAGAGKVRLGDVCSFSKGQQINGKELSDSYDYPFINGGVSPSGNWKDYNVEKGAITISEGGNSCGFVNYFEVPFWCGAHCYYFYELKLEPKYFYYALKANEERLMGLRSGICMPNIRKGDLDEFEFCIDWDKATQQRIADELDRLCALKKNAEDRLVLLDQIVKSRFVEMFGDVEMNPHGFEVKRLDDVCSSIIRGPFGSALKKEFFIPKSDKAYKVYEQKHAIQKSEKIGSYYVSEEKFKELSRFECRPGDIIMSCSGTMGELFQLPESCEKGIMNQALCKFTLGNKLSPVYFLSFMSRAISKLQTQGSGIKNIAAVSYVKALKFVLPPLTLQREFAAFVAEVDKSKLTLRETVATLDQLYRAKLQKYFG